MTESTAKQRIEYISGFMEYPEGFCKEDWKDWRPLIARSCAMVTDENLRKKGMEAMSFFNFYFSDKSRRKRA